MLFRTGIIVLAALSTMLVSGCEQRTEDKAQIKRTYADFETCSNSRDGAGAEAVLAAATLEHYGELVKIGLSGTPEQVKARDPMDKYEIVIMRFQGSRNDLAALDGRGYVRHAVSHGWWAVPADDRSSQTLEDMAFKGPDEATAMLVSNGTRTQVHVRFLREEGVWKFDEFFQAAGFDKNVRRQAKEAGMSESDFVIADLEERLAKDIPGTVWEPMK